MGCVILMGWIPFLVLILLSTVLHECFFEVLSELRSECLVGFLPLISTMVVALDVCPAVDVFCLRQLKFCVTVDDRKDSERDGFSVVRCES